MRAAFPRLFALLASGCVTSPGGPPRQGVDAPVAMAYGPVQCNQNSCQTSSWDHADDKTAFESQKVRTYHASQNFTVTDPRLEDRNPAVRDSCSCPRGDWIHADVPPGEAGRAHALGWRGLSQMLHPPAS